MFPQTVSEPVPALQMSCFSLAPNICLRWGTVVSYQKLQLEAIFKFPEVSGRLTFALHKLCLNKILALSKLDFALGINCSFLNANLIM